MKRVKTGSFSRGLSLAKLGLKTGATAAGNYITGGDQDEYLTKQMKTIAAELGELKGSLMKAGQGLSMYGEHFLPKAANDFLKALQFESPPVDWESIEVTIEKELGLSVFQELDIDEKPIASASLGQVHKARDRKTGEVYAMKVQYPGVEDAIYSDIRNLKRILSVAKIIPTSLKTDQLFEEVKEMLIQETDYAIEAEWTKEVNKWVEGDERYVVPKTIDKYCTHKILTTTYIEGVQVDSEAVQNLSKEDKNHLGFAFLNNYMEELFKYKAVQTDPHLGNYRIQLNEGRKPKLVLFDFGAMRKVPQEYGENYLGMVKSSLKGDEEGIIKYGTKLKYLMPDDPQELKDIYVELCKLIQEPFKGTSNKSPFTNEAGEYKFKETDLPKRVASKGAYIAKNFTLRAPPKESIFLDRKLGGTFVFLSVLGFHANAEKWMADKLSQF